MDHFHNNDLEYVVDDPFGDDLFREDEPQRNDDLDDAVDSEFEDDFESVRLFLFLYSFWCMKEEIDGEGWCCRVSHRLIHLL
jgi:hypothetical protein